MNEISRFINERVRPSAEQIKVLRVTLDDHLTKWELIKDQIPNDGTVIDDGRANEGVSQLTGAQLHLLAGVAATLKEQLDSAATEDVTNAVATAQVRSLAQLL